MEKIKKISFDPKRGNIRPIVKQEESVIDLGEEVTILEPIQINYPPDVIIDIYEDEKQEYQEDVKNALKSKFRHLDED